MWYLFFEIWVWLLAAFILGWAAHWFLCCRDKDDDSLSTSTKSNKLADTANTLVATAPAPPAIDDSWKPQGFANRPDLVDDLKRIKGVGAVIERTLNELGVYQFEQISDWDSNNIKWIENFLAFPGRINREDWINQASTLKRGETTEFAARVDKGDIDYNS